MSAAVGTAIGLAAGIFAGAFVIILLAGIAWLWVFGDDPRPGWADIGIAGAGYAVAIAFIVAGGAIGWRHPGGS